MSENAAFDLAFLDTAAVAEQGAELALLHPGTGKALGITIRLAGVDSDIYRKASRKITEKRLNRGRVGKLDLEAVEDEGLTVMAACTLGWSGVVVDGQELPCTRDNAQAVYRRFPWIREQVDAFMGDRANFLPKS